MVTTDLVIEREDGWVEVLLTGSKMIISVMSRDGVLIRFGADSASSGFRAQQGSVIVVDETVWLRDVFEDGISLVAITQ